MNQQIMEEKETFQENVKQLMEKMDWDRAHLTLEQERTLAFKLHIFHGILGYFIKIFSSNGHE
jgi:hypothetical protein